MEPLPGPKTTIQQYSTNQQIESAAWGADREIKCSLVVGLVPDGYRGRDLTQRRAGYSGGVGGARGGGFRHTQTRTGQRANDSPTLSASGTKRTQGRNNPIRGNPALGPWNRASPDRSQGEVQGGDGGGGELMFCWCFNTFRMFRPAVILSQAIADSLMLARRDGCM